MQRKIILTICLVAATALSAFAGTTSWYSVEPPAFGDDRYEGSPTTSTHPCEIFDMRLIQGTTGGNPNSTFSFDIITNFGNQSQRSLDTNSYGDTIYEKGGGAITMAQVPPGDLYIRVREQGSGDDVAVYAFALETRTESNNWATRVLNYMGLTVQAVTAGVLYSGVKFATGTWEDYPEEFVEIPDMALAQALPDLSLSTKPGYPATSTNLANDPDEENSYPTTITSKTGSSTGGSAAWVPSSDATSWAALQASWGGDGWQTKYNGAQGYWTGTFTLPNFDPTSEYVEIWWAMACGNDGVVVAPSPSSFGYVIPLPGSLLLCGIGLGFAAAVRTLRRRSSKQ